MTFLERGENLLKLIHSNLEGSCEKRQNSDFKNIWIDSLKFLPADCHWHSHGGTRVRKAGPLFWMGWISRGIIALNHWQFGGMKGCTCQGLLHFHSLFCLYTFLIFTFRKCWWWPLILEPWLCHCWLYYTIFNLAKLQLLRAKPKIWSLIEITVLNCYSGLLLDVVSDSASDTIKYYFTGADAPLCYALMNIHADCGGRCFHEMIDDWMTHLPEEHESIWMVSHLLNLFVDLFKNFNFDVSVANEWLLFWMFFILVNDCNGEILTKVLCKIFLLRSLLADCDFMFIFLLF